MPTPNIKVLVAEVDGVELELPQERLLHAQDAVFDPGASGIVATDVNAAIIEAAAKIPYTVNAISAAESQNTSATTWVTKTTLVTPSLNAGNYKISWSFKWRASAANRGIETRLRNGGTNITTGIEFIANAAGKPNVSGFRYLTGLSGVYTFTLDFKIGIGTGTVYISEAIIFLERVL